MPDGLEQAARDAKMAAGGTDFSIKTIGWLYGYDAETVVETGKLGRVASGVNKARMADVANQ